MIVVIVLAAVLLFTLIGGVSVFVVGCVRRKEPEWLEESILNTRYGKHYDRLHQSDKFFREHDAQPISVKSDDGLTLRGLWIGAENPKGTILLAHGYRSTKLLDLSMVYSLYHRLGLNLLVPDQRAHGLSEGKYITFGVKESSDMACWVDFHNRTYGEYPMILSGLSMGASTVLYMADMELPSNVKGIIADCGFTSPKEILACVYRSLVHLPAAPALWVANLCSRMFAGFGLWEKDSRRSLQNTKLPVMLAHGMADPLVPYSMSREGYDACTGEKELLLVPDAAHGLSFLLAQEEYTEKIICFLSKYIPEFTEES